MKLAKDLVTLFPKGSNLSKIDLEKLNSEFKRLMIHCEYEALNNLLKKNGFRGGKIQMKLADKRGLSSVDWTTGNYNFYGSAEIDAENLSHEWIHMCQNVLNKDIYEFEKIHGMAEFELVVFLDIIHYMKHGTFMRLDPLSDFPAAAQWISNLVVEDKEKDKIRSFYAIWIVTTCNEFKDGESIRRIPKTIKDISNYYIFADLFFKYSRNYQNDKFVRNQEYGVKTLEILLQAVEENCLDKL